ncbi:hypothetical protein G9G63_09400 [Paenibacillus sp. EKM202P]|uniref:hypothetical protein n=1 Tax=unclassified Paenibacillus TaxID=185978 RepID=UPI001628E846|nr:MULTISPECIES: hypothetical protein [unclassified Paenibacillus]KAF6565364.1 hypothetical protein G9G63_09400 [Paenibacillus sp. EKM202P]KAF6569311.1 hypothetical protein G9G64_12695 [Paenibacillus sp. EKM207P]
MDRIEFEINEKNEIILTESKTMRDELVFKDSVLEKVKAVTLIDNTSETTIKSVSEYYEVSTKTIEATIKRHRDEFNEYGELRILKAQFLRDFKTLLHDEGAFKGINSLTLISRRGILRIGMLLTESEVAKTIRHYLLNIEEITDKEQKQWAIEREISRRERRELTDAIRDFYEGTMKKGRAYGAITDMVYKVLFDTNAQGLREMYGVDDPKATPRDYLSTDDLRKIVKAEKTVASLLLLGKGKREIEIELNRIKEKLLLKS